MIVIARSLGNKVLLAREALRGSGCWNPLRVGAGVGWGRKESFLK